MTAQEISSQVQVAEHPRLQSRRGHVLAALVLVCLSVGVTWPAVLLRRELLLTLFDTYGFLWNLWWAKFSLLDLHQNPYWCGYICWPNGTSLALHSYVIPYGIMSIPFQLLLGSHDGCLVGMRALILFSFASSVLMYFFAFDVTRSRWGAFVAALIFAFLPFRVLHSHHPHVICLEFVVLYAWLFWRLMARSAPRLRDGAAAGAAFALLLYASPEYALFMGLFSVVAGAWSLRDRWPDKNVREMIISLAAVVLFFGIFSCPLLLATVRQSVDMATEAPEDLADLQSGLMDEVKNNHGALLSVLSPNTAHPLRRYLDQPNPKLRSEHHYNQGALSYVAIGLWLLGSLFAPRRKKGLWLLLTGVFFVLWLGPYLSLTSEWNTGIPLPYLFLHKYVPPFGWGSDTQRFMPIWVMCMAIVAAFGMRWLVAKVRERPTAGRWASGAAVALCVAICLEQLVAPLPFGPHPIPECYRDIAADPEPFAVFALPPSHHSTLYFQTIHQKPMVFWKEPSYIPRHSPHAMDLFRNQESLWAFLEPETFFEMQPAEQAAIIEANRRIFREIDLKYVVLDRVPVAIHSGFVIRIPLDMRFVQQHERLLMLHKPLEVKRYRTSILFRFL